MALKTKGSLHDVESHAATTWVWAALFETLLGDLLSQRQKNHCHMLSISACFYEAKAQAFSSKEFSMEQLLQSRRLCSVLVRESHLSVEILKRLLHFDAKSQCVFWNSKLTKELVESELKEPPSTKCLAIIGSLCNQVVMGFKDFLLENFR